MSFWDDFTGASQQRDLRAGRTAYQGQLTTGRDLANTSYGQAADQFRSYSATGQASTQQWADAMGLNGPEARARAQATYTSDPIFTAMGDRALRGISHGVAASGQTGAGIQAGTNAMVNDYNSYLDRLMSGGSMGMQAASGIAGAYGRQGDANMATGQQLASGEQSFANSMAASRSTAINNILGLGSLAVGAYTGYAFPRPPGGAAGRPQQTAPTTSYAPNPYAGLTYPGTYPGGGGAFF